MHLDSEKSIVTAIAASIALTLAVNSAQAVVVESGVSGRFISITNNGAGSRLLHVNELEAFTTGSTVKSTVLEPLYNKALTSQGASFESQIGSTAHGSNIAPLDGIQNTGASTFTLNGGVGNQMVYDLGTTRNLSTVKLWQRADGCCQDRLSNFTVAVLADNGGGLPGATVFNQSFPGQVNTNSFAEFNLLTGRQILPGGAGVIGTEIQGESAVRFIRVRNNQDGGRLLGIGEIEAFATGVVPSAVSGLSTNELTGLSFESQIFPAGAAHGANTAPFNNTLDSGAAVYTANGAAGNEYVVDLNANVDLGAVRLFNRTDCCQDRLSNYTVSLLKATAAGVAGDEVFSFNVPGQTPNTPGFTQITVPAIPDAFTIKSTDQLIIDVNLDTNQADLFSVGNGGLGFLTIEAGASLILNIVGAGDRTLNILDFGGLSGAFNVSFIGTGGYVVNTSNLLTTGQVTINTIPEPATAAMLLMGLAGVMRRRTRTA